MPQNDPDRTAALSPGPSDATLAPMPGAAYRAFVPGALLGGRYRVVGLLGRGGMGEVYQAQDLRLGETVALKLLPPDLADDAVARERLRDEVRAARRVTHPGVCRVHDLVELDGHLVLTMEHIDGEDLGSLLRRVGHLPARRATEVAREIAAGLAAIHAQGLLHRDLKPGNVMLDGRGRAHITDFGLAIEGVGRRGELAGTPAYMAPEQLEHGGASRASDLYALGLVLWELFTGEHPYPDRGSIAAMAAERRTPPPDPATRAPGLDERIGAMLGACLDPRPETRCRSAAEVLAALPGGGEALALVVAAGETPSPEQVAGAASNAAFGSRRAGTLLALAVVGALACAALAPHSSASGLADLRLPPAALADRARQVLAAVGAPSAANDRLAQLGELAAAFATSPHTAAEIAPLLAAPVGPIGFAWIQSAHGAVDAARPTLRDPGDALVLLDPAGRLRHLEVMPPWTPAPAARAAAVSETAWNTLLERAELPRERLQPATPALRPPFAVEERRAWRWSDGSGSWQVEAAAADGRPVFFDVARPGETPPAGGWSFWGVVELVLVALALACLPVVRRNLAAGRGDRLGARRLASAVFLLGVLPGATEFVESPPRFLHELVPSLGEALFFAAVVWLLYVAVEPTIRRARPLSAVAWIRLLQGRWRDPLVGRELLFGVAVGAVAFALLRAGVAARLLNGGAVLLPYEFMAGPAYAGPLSLLRRLASAYLLSAIFPFLPLVAEALLLPLVRSRAVAVTAAVVLSTGLTMLSAGSLRSVGWAFAALVMTALVLRRGLLAGIGFTLVRAPLSAVPLTLDPQRFYFPSSLLALAVVVALAAAGWWIATRGERPTGPAPVS